jgi:sigma-B regulation protein RsbU (phosphoserine phosphatase)
VIPASSPEELDSERLRKALHFLAELGQVVASNTQLQPILDWVVLRTTQLLEADEGCLRLLEAEAGLPTSRTMIKKQSQGIISGSWPPIVAMSVTGYLLHRGDHVATPDILADERFQGLKGLDTRIRAMLAVPLKLENRLTGLLAVTEAAAGRQWTEDDVELLSIVAGNSAGVIEQARLRVEAEEKKRLEAEARRIDNEFEQARATQMRIVPAHPLRLGSWEVSGRVTPARQVGGDSFDYFLVGGRRLGFSIGDVSGKGLSAALLMMTAQSYLRVFCSSDRPLPEKIRLLNQGVTHSAEPGKFITLFYGELDPEEGLLRYVNAGHNYPFLRRADGSLEPLIEGGLVLGFSEDMEYAQGESSMAPGDSLLLYSDGVSEAMDLRRQEYGEDRLQEVWRRFGTLPPEDFIAKLMSELEAFRAGAPQSDDITLVVLGAARA